MSVINSCISIENCVTQALFLLTGFCGLYLASALHRSIAYKYSILSICFWARKVAIIFVV